MADAQCSGSRSNCRCATKAPGAKTSPAPPLAPTKSTTSIRVHPSGHHRWHQNTALGRSTKAIHPRHPPQQAPPMQAAPQHKHTGPTMHTLLLHTDPSISRSARQAGLSSGHTWSPPSISAAMLCSQYSQVCLVYLYFQALEVTEKIWEPVQSARRGYGCGTGVCHGQNLRGPCSWRAQASPNGCELMAI